MLKSNKFLKKITFNVTIIVMLSILTYFLSADCRSSKLVKVFLSHTFIPERNVTMTYNNENLIDHGHISKFIFEQYWSFVGQYEVKKIDLGYFDSE